MLQSEYHKMRATIASAYRVVYSCLRHDVVFVMTVKAQRDAKATGKSRFLYESILERRYFYKIV